MKKIQSKLNSLTYTNQEIKDIIHLIKMTNFDQNFDKDIVTIKKEQDNTKLTTKQISDWARILSNSPIIMKIWNFKLTVTSRDAIAKGLKGKDIGDYINKKESELFKKDSF